MITMKWTIQTMRFISVLLIGFLYCTLVAAKSITLDKIEFSDSPSTAQVMLEFSQDVDVESFELHNPERYVVDLFDVKLATDLPKGNLSFPLKKIRSNSDGEKLRLVMDLEHYVKPQLMKLNRSKNEPVRLFIDIPKQVMKASRAGIAPQHKTKLKKFSSGLPAPAPLKVQSEEVSLHTESLQELPNPGSVKLRKPRDVVVVIDPGHGGKDPGAKGCNGTQEKDVVLAIAKRLQAHINQQPGFRAVLTRKGDYYLGLRERLAIAREYRGDMFIAIHADAHEHLDACGIGVYALSQRGATSEAARWLAQRENQSELVGGVDLTDKDHVLKSVLIDLSQTQSITASLHMGSVLLENLGKFAPLHHPNVEQAAFVVLKSPDIPSLLIETGFISNTREERRLRNPLYQEQIAGALLLGIKNYFVQHPPRGSSLALMARGRGQV
jgi:N-acetylmuramoyl-L-alanine amidase